MLPPRSTFPRAIGWGALLHLLAGVLFPVAVLTLGGVLHSRSLESDLARTLFFGSLLITSALYLWHQILVLLPTTLLLRRQARLMTMQDVIQRLMSTTIFCDILLATALMIGVEWKGASLSQVLFVIVPLIPGLYGVLLYSRAVCAGLPLLPMVPLESDPAPGGKSAPPRRLGLQVYVSTAVGFPLLMAFGWPQPWAITLAVTLFSLIIGKSAVRLAEKWDVRNL